MNDFEFTSALNIFDLFKIPLFHGWVLDPQDVRLKSIIEDRTYNQVVEWLITKKNSENPDEVQTGKLSQFLSEVVIVMLNM